MALNEISFSNAEPVSGYGTGFFRIGAQLYHGAVLTGPQGTQVWAGLEDMAPLLALKDHIDVLFLGTGAEIAHVPANVRESLEQAGIGVEVMPSPTAARTYNVVLSEGRRVALAMLPV